MCAHVHLCVCVSRGNLWWTWWCNTQPSLLHELEPHDPTFGSVTGTLYCRYFWRFPPRERPTSPKIIIPSQSNWHQPLRQTDPKSLSLPLQFGDVLRGLFAHFCPLLPQTSSPRSGPCEAPACLAPSRSWLLTEATQGQLRRMKREPNSVYHRSVRGRQRSSICLRKEEDMEEGEEKLGRETAVLQGWMASPWYVPFIYLGEYVDLSGKKGSGRMIEVYGEFLIAVRGTSHCNKTKDWQVVLSIQMRQKPW